ncbi:hypothetical protein EJG51_002685 [Undibacterium piscinae]|uniref:Uncharacterized protein n=1 Tax=Undibacterium piscinae TaxID=2495591 RepID=A0A6M4A4H4_9BURK|nr:hypothetical protein EJG51_002685 [Undibacterium piscinae]
MTIKIGCSRISWLKTENAQGGLQVKFAAAANKQSGKAEAIAIGQTYLGAVSYLRSHNKTYLSSPRQLNQQAAAEGNRKLYEIK